MIAWDRRNDLVVVPRATRLSRRFHLHEIHVVQEPTVFAELAASYVKIVDWHLTHFGHNRLRLVSAGCLDCAKIVTNCGIDGGTAPK